MTPIITLFKKYGLYYTFFLLLTFSFYSNSLNNGYSIDDFLVTSTNEQKNELTEKGISGIPEIFGSHYVQNSKQKYDYRPITTSSFAIEHSVFKSSENKARVSHFINIFIYFLICCLLFNLLIIILNNTSLALIITGLFLIHPIHNEVVNNIKSRDELLVVFFGLSAIISLIRYYDRKKIYWAFAALILLLLGILSKRTGMTFVVLAPLTLYFFRSVSLKKIALVLAIAVIPLLLYKILGKNLLSDPVYRTFLYFENPMYVENTFTMRIAMFFYCCLFYITMLFIPYPLRYYYGYDQVPIIGFGDWQFWVGLIVVTSLLYIAFRGLKDKKIYSFGILFFFFGIGGATNLLFPVPGIVAERFAFVASIGFSVSLGFFLFNVFKLKNLKNPFSNRLFLGLSILIFIPSLLYIRDRNTVWKDKLTLYRSDINVLNKSAKANSLLASEYYIKFNQNLAANGLSKIEQDMKYADSAYFYFNRALSIFPDYSSCHNNLASVYFMAKLDYFNGVKHGKIATSIDPENHEAMFNLATNYAEIANGLNIIKNNGIKFGDSIVNIDSSKLKLGVLNTVRSKYMLNFIPMYLNKSRPKEAINIVRYVTQLDGDKDSLSNDSFATKIIEGIQSKKSGKYLKDIFDLFDKKLYEYCAKDAQTSVDSLYTQYKVQALESYEKVVELEPEFKNTYKSIFNYLLQWKEYRLYIKWNEKYVKVANKKEQPNVYVNIGNAYLNLGDKAKAKANFTTAINHLNKELNVLLMVTNKTLEQNQRISYIQNEIKKLKAFMQSQEISF